MSGRIEVDGMKAQTWRVLRAFGSPAGKTALAAQLYDKGWIGSVATRKACVLYCDFQVGETEALLYDTAAGEVLRVSFHPEIDPSLTVGAYAGVSQEQLIAWVVAVYRDWVVLYDDLSVPVYRDRKARVFRVGAGDLQDAVEALLHRDGSPIRARPWRTEQERVAKATPEARRWLQRRLHEADEWEWKGYGRRAPCFFCGRLIAHVDSGGIGLAINVRLANGSCRAALCCTLEPCSGPLWSEASEDAKNWLIRREDTKGADFIEVIGP